MMNIEYRLNIKDYQEANQAHLRSNRWVYLFCWVTSVLFIIIGLFSIGFGIFLSQTSHIINGFFLAAFGILFCNPSANIIQRYSIARIWKSQPSIREAIAIEVDEEGLKLKSASFESHLKWQVYTHFLETKNIFMLYQSKASFNIVPKRAFESDEQVMQFRELLRIKIVKNRQV